MALPVALGLASAGLSIAGSLSQNAAITKAATQQLNANTLYTNRKGSVMANNYALQADEVNNEVGMALTALDMQFRSGTADVKAKRAETQIYGNTAERVDAVNKMKQALQADSIMQQAESKMQDLLTTMANNMYEIEAEHATNKQNYANMMSKRQSTFSMLAGAASAGLSGYSSGVSLATSMTNLQNAQMTQQALVGLMGSK